MTTHTIKQRTLLDCVQSQCRVVIIQGFKKNFIISFFLYKKKVIQRLREWLDDIEYIFHYFPDIFLEPQRKLQD